MQSRFKTIEYLKTGNSKQKRAFNTLKTLNVFEDLSHYTPILTGTVPIEIDLPESDLDIICYCNNFQKFTTDLRLLYGHHLNFQVKTYAEGEFKDKAAVAVFNFNGFEIEIFGKNTPTEKQNAYRHMLIEAQILNSHGPEFKLEIIRLKKNGFKTEPAFAKALGLEGNPYQALLNLEQNTK
ncbi:MAG: hypothetical protein BM564_01525 [Bacteroidetes bacterium MedPE-SWsnd-G2]|nr:MAG: hypothetical protein BM564_01525 [Bacteroidetes bacterium MedPE-SWsnd-G2]